MKMACLFLLAIIPTLAVANAKARKPASVTSYSIKCTAEVMRGEEGSESIDLKDAGEPSKVAALRGDSKDGVYHAEAEYFFKNGKLDDSTWVNLTVGKKNAKDQSQQVIGGYFIMARKPHLQFLDIVPPGGSKGTTSVNVECEKN